ncbi:MAG TPA: histidine--tRNA ligase [Candidatus Saccharimonadales bacterium]|nr:histidine--tRNA ligase [Candidatus Saccharimonadales bacterium]
MAMLTTQPYKGSRDFYPEDMRVQNHIFSVWRKMAERYGYEEYMTPMLEPLELYAAKSGQELVNDESYLFVDRGNRQVMIRPEMTPSVSRLVAGRRQELPYPVRWYSVANFMRYQRPQRGRLREFWQLNVDIFGVQTIDAEVELITMADQIMKQFGATDKMYTIKINSRSLVNFMMAEYLELDVVQSQLMMKLFDRKDKVSPAEFIDQASEIFDRPKVQEGLKKIGTLFAAKSMGDLPKQILESTAIREVQMLFTLLREHGVKSVTFDIGLMRGLDYYTDIVFEVFDTNPMNARSLFGGGRYDGLVGLFGVEPVPTAGFAIGDVTFADFLETHKLIPGLRTNTEVYIVVLGDALKGAQKLADRLRNQGVNTELDITGRKIDKQIKTAIKKGVPFLLFVGQKELDEETYTLKDVAQEKEHKLSFSRAVSTIKDYRHQDDDIV